MRMYPRTLTGDVHDAFHQDRQASHQSRGAKQPLRPSQLYRTAGAAPRESRTAARIRKYAGDDQVLNECWNGLLAETNRYDQEIMSSMVMKQAYFVAEMGMKGRARDGKARRSS